LFGFWVGGYRLALHRRAAAIDLAVAASRGVYAFDGGVNRR